MKKVLCALLLLAALCAGAHDTAAIADSIQVESAFSPDGSSEALIVKVIDSARLSLRLSAYSFTSATVAHALTAAKQRGVDVAIVVDHHSNITDDRSGRAHAALDSLVEAGISVRTNFRYAIHHDKFIVADALHVETGSFNFSRAAAYSNSENVLVVWNSQPLADSYLMHWQSRFDQGEDYVAR